ncbi:MAG: DUF2306 domain-containing protein [Bacteroidetes bacterium]|nr:DUF2306 domain-containing protein [Bacteroidota bacterium]
MHYLIIAHAVLGGIALLTGTLAVVFKKGSKKHKSAGRIFYNSMLFSAMIALIISISPGHENPFLFCIGLFSTYFVLSGKRSLKYRNNYKLKPLDKIISYTMGITALCMIFSFLLFDKFNLVLTIFGVVGLSFSIRDILLFRKPKILPENRIKLHLGKMMGGYISAFTAFLVVNEVLPGLINWFLPGILGTFVIIYHIRKQNTIQAKN